MDRVPKILKRFQRVPKVPKRLDRAPRGTGTYGVFNDTYGYLRQQRVTQVPFRVIVEETYGVLKGAYGVL